MSNQDEGISVREFFTKKIEQVVQFKAYWENKQTTDKFPKKLFEEDWEEQFLAWLDSEKNKL